MIADCGGVGPVAIKLDPFVIAARWQIPEPAAADLSLGPCRRPRRFSPSGGQVITVTKDDVRIWGIVDRKLITGLKDLPKDLTNDPVCRWSDDGKHIFLLLASDSSTAIGGGIWSATTGVKELDIGSEGKIGSAEFSPNSELIASATADGAVQVWSVSTGRLMKTIQTETTSLRTIAWSPDSAAIVVAGVGGMAHVWTIDGSESFALRASAKDVTALAWGGEGKLIASSGTADNGTHVVTIWSAKDGAKLNEIQWEDTITHLVFGPEDHRLLGFRLFGSRFRHCGHYSSVPASQ